MSNHELTSSPRFALLSSPLSRTVEGLFLSFAAFPLSSYSRPHTDSFHLLPYLFRLKTHAALTSLGIPCTLLLDSAVAYVMDRISVVLVGSEAVVESGGLVAGLGTYQIALLARALNKPFYALAESYKFLRLFPLSQSDLPLLPGTSEPLAFEPVLPSPYEEGGEGAGEGEAGESKSKYSVDGKRVVGMTPAMLANNPRYDVTSRHLINLVISDVGILTPELVGSYCGIFSE